MALITDGPTGGIMGLILEADDSQLHSLSVRPLLPGEGFCRPLRRNPPADAAA